MAYEGMKYEVILQRMMDRVTTEYPNLDTREGSIIYNALAPAAVELAIMYTELDNVLKESFVDTASREYVLIACEQMGMDISRFDATYGVHKGEFDEEVPIGSRWNCDLYNYTVTEYIGLENALYTYRMSCETSGTAPNNTVGDLTAITDNPTGLSHAELTKCLIEGENETADDDVRVAYYNYINNATIDGNIAQYKQWCNEYYGIGNSKIIPLWNGANTVKVSILSASNEKASDELIAEFQEYIDPNSEGMGNGVAPIGSIVTVTTATEIPINVSATVSMKDGYTDTSVINATVENYFREISYEQSIISYMKLGSMIMEATGVDYITNLTINGGVSDIILGEEEIPMLGETKWTVS